MRIMYVFRAYYLAYNFDNTYCCCINGVLTEPLSFHLYNKAYKVNQHRYLRSSANAVF